MIFTQSYKDKFSCNVNLEEACPTLTTRDVALVLRWSFPLALDPSLDEDFCGYSDARGGAGATV